MQMKFYSPLTADFFPNDTEDLDDDYSEYEGIPYTGKELTATAMLSAMPSTRMSKIFTAT